jgi:hypothetical protein
MKLIIKASTLNDLINSVKSKSVKSNSFSLFYS